MVQSSEYYSEFNENLLLIIIIDGLSHSVCNSILSFIPLNFFWQVE
jgi:hypothetical protein